MWAGTVLLHVELLSVVIWLTENIKKVSLDQFKIVSDESKS